MIVVLLHIEGVCEESQEQRETISLGAVLVARRGPSRFRLIVKLLMAMIEA